MLEHSEQKRKLICSRSFLSESEVVEAGVAMVAVDGGSDRWGNMGW